MARAGFSAEYFCYDNLGYSPKYVDELYDVLEECSKMVRYYLDTSVGFSDEIKADIKELSMDVDTLFLEFNATYILIARMVNEAKKEFFLSQKVKADKETSKVISQNIEKLGIDLEKLIEKTKKYMKKIHGSKAGSAA